MDAKHPKENQSKILMLLASNLMVGIVIGLFLPLIIATGLVSLSFFFNYPMPPESELNSSDNAECKETRFPTWFTASACILCWILVPIPWKLLNDYCGKLLKHPEENAFLAFVQLALYTLGFTYSLVLVFYFGSCTVFDAHKNEIRKKSLDTTKISPISISENGKKSLEAVKISPISNIEIGKKSVNTAKIFPISDIENVQPKS
ncbi:hypothetical protein POUND7_017949 [Theobroma cacao]